MRINNYNSLKIKILSFLMIIMVVYIHSYYLEAKGRIIPNMVQHIGSAITSVAVPLFYAISGFLFFNGIDSIQGCFPKIKNRIYTLLIPYLIWNVVFVLWYVAITFIPGASAYVNSDMLANLTLSAPIDSLYFLFVKPAGFQLWFLRDLILFVLCSPLFYWMIKKCKWVAFCLILVTTGWMTRFWLTSFIFGGTLAMCHENGLDLFNRKEIVRLCGIVYVMYIILNVFGISIADSVPINNYILQLCVIFPMIYIWGGYNIIVPKDYKVPKALSLAMNYTFFIFLFHEPAFNIIKKMGLKIMGDGDVSLVLLYITNPWIMIALSVYIGYLLSHVTPKFYSILVGGR